MPQSKNDNAVLLRDLYEDNLRLKHPTEQGTATLAPPPSWSKRCIVLVALLTVVFGGVGSYPYTPPAPSVLSLDDQITQSFGTRADPGLHLTASADLSLASVYGLGVKTIVLDPGHGGRDAGAVGTSGLTEKTVALDVALRLERRLLAHGFRVHLTRTGDTGLTLRERVDFAVQHEADLLISIHLNALPTDEVSMVEDVLFQHAR